MLSQSAQNDIDILRFKTTSRNIRTQTFPGAPNAAGQRTSTDCWFGHTTGKNVRVTEEDDAAISEKTHVIDQWLRNEPEQSGGTWAVS